MAVKRESLVSGMPMLGDVNVQVLIDSRVMMSLCQWLESNGEVVRYFSDIVKESLYILADNLVGNGLELEEDTNVAKDYLEYRFGVNLNRGGKGKRNLLENMRISNRNKEVRDEILRNGIDWDLVRKIQEEDEKKKNDQLEQIRRARENMKFDENGICINPTVNLQARPDNIEEWKKVEKPSVDKEVINKKSTEYIVQKAAKMLEEQGYNPMKENLTPKKMTDEEELSWIEKDRKKLEAEKSAWDEVLRNPPKATAEGD